jgi:hypothetical protein
LHSVTLLCRSWMPEYARFCNITTVCLALNVGLVYCINRDIGWAQSSAS